MLLIFVVLSLALYYFDNLLVTDELLYEEMTNYLDHNTAIESIKKRQRLGFNALKYSLQAGWILFKILGTIAIFVAGLYIYNVKISFKEALSLAILPYFIFLLPDILKITWFNIFSTDYSVGELNNFPNFSISNLLVLLKFDDSGIFSFLKRLLSVFNIYNFIFCYGFAYNLAISRKDIDKVYIITFLPYFLTLLILKTLTLLVTSTL